MKFVFDLDGTLSFLGMKFCLLRRAPIEIVWDY